MADITLTPRTPLEGADETIGTLRLHEVTDSAILSLAIPHGGQKEVANALKKLGLAMPGATRSTVEGDTRALQTTPDQLILVFGATDGSVATDIHKALGQVGYVTVQTDNWVMCELAGPDARQALERICPIDLDDDAFPVGAFARTSMEHLGALIIRNSDTSYQLLSASSSARSFWDALKTSMHNIAD